MATKKRAKKADTDDFVLRPGEVLVRADDVAVRAIDKNGVETPLPGAVAVKLKVGSKFATIRVVGLAIAVGYDYP